MFLTDLVSILASENIGVYGIDVFVGSKSVIPAGDGPFVTLIETGGAGEEGTHNLSPTTPAYVRPSAQVVCRALNYMDARAKAEECYLAFNFVNTFVAGTWYRILSPKQEPFDLGVDDAGRARVVFNIECVKRLSAATS